MIQKLNEISSSLPELWNKKFLDRLEKNIRFGHMYGAPVKSEFQIWLDKFKKKYGKDIR